MSHWVQDSVSFRFSFFVLLVSFLWELVNVTSDCTLVGVEAVTHAFVDRCMACRLGFHITVSLIWQEFWYLFLEITGLTIISVTKKLAFWYWILTHFLESPEHFGFIYHHQSYSIVPASWTDLLCLFLAFSCFSYKYHASYQVQNRKNYTILCRP